MLTKLSRRLPCCPGSKLLGTVRKPFVNRHVRQVLRRARQGRLRVVTMHALTVPEKDC
jgi:hypothetical protein